MTDRDRQPAPGKAPRFKLTGPYAGVGLGRIRKPAPAAPAAGETDTAPAAETDGAAALAAATVRSEAYPAFLPCGCAVGACDCPDETDGADGETDTDRATSSTTEHHGPRAVAAFAALQAIVLSPATRQYLRTHDPKAVQQAARALSALSLRYTIDGAPDLCWFCFAILSPAGACDSCRLLAETDGARG